MRERVALIKAGIVFDRGAAGRRIRVRIWRWRAARLTAAVKSG